MLQSPREETEGKVQMLLPLRKNGLTSLFKEVRVLKAEGLGTHQVSVVKNRTLGPVTLIPHRVLLCCDFMLRCKCVPLLVALEALNCLPHAMVTNHNHTDTASASTQRP